jgi:hypothetical protein
VKVRRDWRPGGYHHYRRDWQDDFFFFSSYDFYPSYDTCVISPWYYYPHLPGYVRRNRIFFVLTPSVLYIGGTGFYWSGAPIYHWNDSESIYNSSGLYGNYDNYGRSAATADLDYALEDLVTAFKRNNRRAIGRLVPMEGRVGIYVDERYDYSLEAEDFYDLMIDNVSSTDTRDYEILEVRTWRGEEARVLARHEYRDPWGGIRVVFHTYRMVRQRGGYVITDFGTSDFRPRF